MNPTQSAQQGIEWLEQQLTDLAGIRNATPRDPSFKNWRQGTLTVMQRIWPGDQERSERFRRIPFSPADPRADARAIREWYSRGCQEATRVLNGFVEEIRKIGVPDAPDDVASKPSSGEFEVDFPTVDLPSGDLGTTELPADVPDNMFADLVDHTLRPSDSPMAAPRGLEIEPSSAVAPMADPPLVSAPDSRQVKKGLNMKAKLRDLLGFAQLSAKAIAGYPRDPAPPLSPPAARSPRPTPPKLDVVPVGDEAAIDRPLDSSPTLELKSPTPEASVLAPAPVTPGPPLLPIASPPPATQVPPAAAADAVNPEPGMSVVMSRPTTLRASIEKVSIESLISPEFRSPNAEKSKPGGTEVTSVTPAEVGPPVEAVVPIRVPEPVRLPEPVEAETPIELPEPVEDDAPDEFDAGADPDELLAEAAAELEAAESAPPPPVVSATPPESISKVLPMPPRATSQRPPLDPVDEDDPAVAHVDPEAFARATEDFMRSSPVLGAKGRRVKRGYDEPAFDGAGFEDADAIAVASMVEDLQMLGVPAARQAETRARLRDLARRLESGELDWAALRKAVWFAMEHPEVARRLMPVLLPWIDRAA